jgi:hypothetical protein
MRAKDEAQLHKDLAVEGFAHAAQAERALEEILAERFRKAFHCKGTQRGRLPSPRGTVGIVANDARTAMLVRLDHEAQHPPAEGVEVQPSLVSSALHVFSGSRVRFRRLLRAQDDAEAPLLIQQEGSCFGVLVALLVRDVEAA